MVRIGRHEVSIRFDSMGELSSNLDGLTDFRRFFPGPQIRW
jgi:hypothetical protein